MSSPNVARIASLASWSKFFHPTDGVFRLPSTAGATIEHIDIDLRFVLHDPDFLAECGDIYLPAVHRVTLRGGEYVQDSEERMECLSEVLCALNPSEVLWLNAFDHPAEQQTMATILVHPAIITAGELWQSKGNLRKLVIQGGFPVPNLTAPTPYAVTPAVTPGHSPGPNQRSFLGTAGFPFTGLPSLSLTKPKPIDEAKLKERAERQRLAEYTLKPRWAFAFGSWGVTEIRWKFDGRFTPAAIQTILTTLFSALDDTFPSTSHKVHRDMPSLLTFSPVPKSLFDDLKALTVDYDRLAEHLGDTTFVSTDSTHFARLFDGDAEPEAEYRRTKRIKAEMMLLQNGLAEIVHIDEVVAAEGGAVMDGLVAPVAESQGASPVLSFKSLSTGETDGSDEEEGQAQTPPMGSSIHVSGGPTNEVQEFGKLKLGQENVQEGRVAADEVF